MNMRCMYCQTMFGLSRESMLIGLQTIESEHLTHYEFYCPKCRRANRVERTRLERANPNWRETLKVVAKEAVQEQKAQAAGLAKPAPKTEAAPQPARSRPKKAPAKPKTAPKPATKAASAKPSAKKSAAKTSKPASKPAAKSKAPAAKAPKATSKTSSAPKAGATKKSTATPSKTKKTTGKTKNTK
jgi:hypothetical protein